MCKNTVQCKQESEKHYSVRESLLSDIWSGVLLGHISKIQHYH